MADTVELKSPPVQPPADLKLPEAVIKEDDGVKAVVSVDSTQKVPEAKPEEKKASGSAERPAWLPEGFNTPEELAEAYKKIQTPPDKVAKQDTTPEQAAETVKKAGLDLKALEAEYAANKGQLSAESMTKLEKAGVTKEQVAEYIEGREAKNQLYIQDLHKSVGGQEEMEKTLKWAGDTLSEAERVAANRALQSGDSAQAQLVLQGLHSRRLQASGVEPKLVSGQATPTKGVPGYESTQQMLKDMMSIEYKTDQAFRDMVAKRIAASQM